MVEIRGFGTAPVVFWSNLNLKCDLKHVNPDDFFRFMSRHGWRSAAAPPHPPNHHATP